jgi:signal recognition particle receptor subunit beta
MVSINYATREVSCKIVYYGPGLSGKTTNLQYVHQKVPANTKGKLISLATDADRTLYFDFLPINIGAINGFAAKFQLYTVPGQVYYNATRKLVLRGVDGLVFVADSQPDKMDENIESLNNLRENLAEYGYNLDEIPIVIQYNKQDLPNVLGTEELHRSLNPAGWPEFRASATEGFGVFDTLKCILKLVLDKARTGGTTTPQPAATEPAAVPSRPTAPPPETAPQPVLTYASKPEVSPPAPSELQPSYQAVAMQRVPVAEPAPPQADDASRPERMLEREPMAPPPSQDVPATPVYRPFPGNTAEDEDRMFRKHAHISVPNHIPVPAPPVGEASQPGRGSDRSPDRSGSAVTPRMAPSLKADKPPKKRSFFKRLFGLR